MLKRLLVAAGALVGISPAWAQWTSEPNGATETLVSVSSPSRNFEVAVGNNGQIVHFTGDAVGTVVPSGTGKNLFDVHAVDASFAVASGQDVRLIWDGSSWSPIFPESMGNPRNFTPIWAPPEKNLVLIQELGTGLGFNTLCAYDPADPGATEACRASRDPILTFCGNFADFKALQTDGSVLRFVDGTLSNESGVSTVVFDQPGGNPLDLIAAYIPPQACIPGNAPPLEILAVHRGPFNNEFWRFYRDGWTKQGDAGAGQTLTGMAGVGEAEVIAVGRVAPTMRGPASNEGVAWAYDGSDWTQESLPMGTAGLADVSFVVTFDDRVFDDGFEAAPVAKGGLGTQIAEFRARGEAAATSRRDSSNADLLIDVDLDKALVDPEPSTLPTVPVEVDDIITWRVTVRNEDSRSKNALTLRDDYFPSQQTFIDSPDCSTLATPGRVEIVILDLDPGQSISCDLRFQVQEGAVRPDRDDPEILAFRVFNSVSFPNPWYLGEDDDFESPRSGCHCTIDTYDASVGRSVSCRRIEAAPACAD